MLDVKKLINKILDFTKQEQINKEMASEVDVIKSNNVVQMDDIVIPDKPDGICENVFLSTCFEPFPTNAYMAYFKDGELFNIQPRNKKLPLYEERQIAYEARFIISDGKKYDLEDPISISNLEIPKFNKINGMPNVTFDLAYILQQWRRPALLDPSQNRDDFTEEYNFINRISSHNWHMYEEGPDNI